MYKPFDKKLHDQFDQVGRTIAKKFLEYKMKDVKVVDNPDPIGIDLLIKKNNKTIAVCEVEVRRNAWKGPNHTDFKFDTLNVPSRKEEFFIKSSYPVIFISINEEQTALLWCYGKDILNCKKKNNPNIYLDEENFFKVPLDKTHKFVIKKNPKIKGESNEKNTSNIIRNSNVLEYFC